RDKLTLWRQQQQFESHFNGDSPKKHRAPDVRQRHRRCLEFGCIKEVNQSMLARQSQLPIKTFVNCLGVFEVGKKVKR
ncbi:MAG: hypothetical protein ACYSQZ_00315, partial [Planctomycetota bacterium]